MMKSWLLAKIKQSYLFTIKRFAKKNKKQHQQIVYLLSFPSTSNYIIEKLFQKYQKRLTICYTKNATDLARTYQEKGCPIYCIDSQLILFRHIVPLLKSARVILCDNYFAILGGIDFLPKTKIVQLWHANGAIKKFGLEAHYAKKATQTDQKRYRDVYRRYTHCVVSSPKMASIFERSYQRELTFLPFGYPPTDQYFKRDDEKIKEMKKIFGGKKLLLYAPTYREERGDFFIDFNRLLTELPEWNILVQLHPHDFEQLQHLKKIEGIITNFKGYKIQDLFPIIDCLVTDYSSIPFEYSLSNPSGMICYFCYDYDLYDKTVGIQDCFKKQKNIAKTQDELVRIIQKGTSDLNQFNQEWNTYVKGNAIEQLVEWVNAQYEY